MLDRLLQAGIVILEQGQYVFYREEQRVVLGCNSFIARNTIYYYPELFARFFKETS